MGDEECGVIDLGNRKEGPGFKDLIESPKCRMGLRPLMNFFGDKKLPNLLKENESITYEIQQDGKPCSILKITAVPLEKNSLRLGFIWELEEKKQMVPVRWDKASKQIITKLEALKECKDIFQKNGPLEKLAKKLQAVSQIQRAGRDYLRKKKAGTFEKEASLEVVEVNNSEELLKDFFNKKKEGALEKTLGLGKIQISEGKKGGFTEEIQFFSFIRCFDQTEKEVAPNGPFLGEEEGAVK